MSAIVRTAGVVVGAVALAATGVGLIAGTATALGAAATAPGEYGADDDNAGLLLWDERGEDL